MASKFNFKSLAARKRHFADSKFGKLDTKKSDIDTTRNMTHNEYNMLQALSQTVEEQYTQLTTDNLVKIPYFTNNVQGVNIFKENKCPTGNDHGFSLKLVLNNMIREILTHYEYPPEQFNANRLLLHIQYPIEKDVVHDHANLVFDSHIIDNGDYLTIRISDVILYAMVKDCSRNFLSLSGTRDIYLLGSDVQREDYFMSRSEFDSYFITLTKTIFATTLIGRNIDQLGLMDYPAYQFSLGTYSLTSTNKFTRVMSSNSLVHVIPFWKSCFHASFLVELATTDVQFSYQHDTMFAYFEHDIQTNCFKQVSDRTQNIMALPLTVTLSNQDDAVEPFSVYSSNINVRNKISNRFDGLKNFNKVKDAMYPKNRAGAKTKLESCLTNLDISQYQTALDIGSAPGTWIDHLLQYDHFQMIHGVTRASDKVDLPMYPEIVKRIASDPRANLIFEDALIYLRASNNYDLIVSDLATKHTNYITQSLDHDYLFTTLLTLINQKLNLGGSFIMKMYDLTPKMSFVINNVASQFADFKIVKPTGSCPTNPEIYIIGICKSETTNVNPINHINYFNYLLQSQICHLNRLLTQGFGIQVGYEMSHINNRLKLTNVEYLPPHLSLCLTHLKFSEYLYPTNLTGTVYDEVTQLGDRYLRFHWYVPLYPEINVRYITHTSVGYESNNISLQHLFIIHHGFIFEDGIKKDFFIVEKEGSCLFSDRCETTCITTSSSQSLPKYQLTLSSLLQSNHFLSAFPGIVDYYQLDYHVKQLSLSKLLELQQFYSVVSSVTILNQFFRESETMRLFYTKNKNFAYFKRSKKQRTNKTLDLLQHDDRKTFVQVYKRNYCMGKTLRQTFYDVLDEYTLQIWEGQLLTTSFCTPNTLYSERETRQICISQPACVQYRRHQHIQPIQKISRR